MIWLRCKDKILQRPYVVLAFMRKLERELVEQLVPKIQLCRFHSKNRHWKNKSGIWWVSSRCIPIWSHETFVEGLLAIFCDMGDKMSFRSFSKINLKAYIHTLLYFSYKLAFGKNNLTHELLTNPFQIYYAQFCSWRRQVLFLTPYK